MASVYEKITSALSSLGKRRDRDSGAQDGARDASANSGRVAKRFRPWDQSDLHGRLETYKPLTWFAKPASVGPVPCAMRGWTNTACDTLQCEQCKAKVVYPAQVPYDQRQAAADLFAPSLTAKHAATCPWRQTQCDPALLAYLPATTNEELCQLYQSLQGKLLKVDVLPDLDVLAIRTIRDASAPYGSYDDLVLGAGSAGGLVPRRRPLNVRITDITGVENANEPSPGDATALGDASDTTTYVALSKLTPQQKARLLALLGWDLEVLQPDSAGGSAALPYAQSTGYSLQHLGVKTKKPPHPPPAAAAATAPGLGGEDDGDVCGRHPMSSVVLKCTRCNSRMGLWNFAGVRPVPTGRLTPSQQAAGAAALLSPRAAGGAGGAAAAAAGAAGADPLSVTIAGGQYGLHGVAGPRPFGGASAAPFRFGSAGAVEPVFGMAALEADAPQQPSVGGFGSPLSSPTPKAAAKKDATAAAHAATPVAALGRAAFAALVGKKRKAQEQGAPELLTPEVDQRAGPSATPGGQDGKRPRLTPQAGFGASPAPAPGHTPGAEEVQPRQLDPLSQHRTWCPWVYTGTPENPHKSGWQHMLSALSAQQQQQQQKAAAAAMDTEMQTDGGLAVDPKQLRDKSLASIRSL